MKDFERDLVQEQSVDTERPGFVMRTLGRIATMPMGLGLMSIGFGVGLAAEGIKTGDVGAVYSGATMVGANFAAAAAVEAYHTHAQNQQNPTE